MATRETVTPLTFPVAFADIPAYLVHVDVTRQAVADEFGRPQCVEEIDGLEVADWWAHQYRCGLQVVLQFLHHNDSGGIVIADSPEINHVIRHLPFATARCTPIDDATLERELKLLMSSYPERSAEINTLHGFQVWRQGDDGNAFKVGDPTSERDARCWVAQLESLGHKQTYWYTSV